MKDLNNRKRKKIVVVKAPVIGMQSSLNFFAQDHTILNK
jgi:hypothetical protein